MRSLVRIQSPRLVIELGSESRLSARTPRGLRDIYAFWPTSVGSLTRWPELRGHDRGRPDRAVKLLGESVVGREPGLQHVSAYEDLLIALHHRACLAGIRLRGFTELHGAQLR